MEDDVRRLKENAKYIVDVSISDVVSFSKTVDSLFTKKYGLADKKRPFGRTVYREGDIRFVHRSKQRFSKKSSLFVIYGPLERKEEINGYISEAIKEYLKSHKDEPKIETKITSTVV